jgi:Rhodanese-like domain
MNKRYLFLAVVVVLLGVGMLFMPGTNDNKQVNPELLLTAIDDPSRFLTTDDITDRLVKKDPALLLLDVRPASEFKSFSIPGSVNLPIDSLLTGPSHGNAATGCQRQGFLFQLGCYRRPGLDNQQTYWLKAHLCDAGGHKPMVQYHCKSHETY